MASNGPRESGTRRDDSSSPRQKTPKGHEIPVPKKADVLADLKKLAPPPKKKSADTSGR